MIRYLFCVSVLITHMIHASLPTLGEAIAFLPGDASFVAIVRQGDSILSNDMSLRSVKGFCCGYYPDTTIGGSLALSSLPPTQIGAMRRELESVIEASSQRAALLCICSPDFDFETSWLGVPYNENAEVRVVRGSVMANNIGPEGIANISTRFASRVPAAPINRVDDENLKVVDAVSICILKIEDAALQKSRTVISPDGTVARKIFCYVPKFRVGYEDGDAFFVARSEPFLNSLDGTVELRYLTFPREQWCTGVNGLEFDPSSVKQLEEPLQIKARGSTLTIRNVPLEIRARIKDKLNPVNGHDWYVFVVAIDYNPSTYGLGRRFNREPIADIEQQLEQEYTDCKHGADAYPKAGLGDDWPPTLKVRWVGEVSEVNCEDVQLVFVHYISGVRLFEQVGIENEQIRVVAGRRLEVWLDQKLENDN